VTEGVVSQAEPPVVERASDSVARKLEVLIYREFEPGAVLPSEAELAASMGVSRLTVREAFRSLQARGLISVSKGRRPTVLSLNSAPVGDFFASAVRQDPRRLLDLLEVRRALEVHAAALAASRAARSSLSAMEASIAAMRAGRDDRAQFNAADLRFHETLAAATGNQMLILLIEALAEPLDYSRQRSWDGHLAQGLHVDQVIEQHASILEAVRRGDAADAVALMQTHLLATERDLRAGLSLRDDR
jgi:GntR family transcriptional repressor for pyruvate dehydrogenase complex